MKAGFLQEHGSDNLVFGSCVSKILSLGHSHLNECEDKCVGSQVRRLPGKLGL
jgi:hypothetical protein